MPSPAPWPLSPLRDVLGGSLSPCLGPPSPWSSVQPRDRSWPASQKPPPATSQGGPSSAHCTPHQELPQTRQLQVLRIHRPLLLRAPALSWVQTPPLPSVGVTVLSSVRLSAFSMCLPETSALCPQPPASSHVTQHLCPSPTKSLVCCSDLAKNPLPQLRAPKPAPPNTAAADTPTPPEEPPLGVLVQLPSLHRGAPAIRNRLCLRGWLSPGVSASATSGALRCWLL